MFGKLEEDGDDGQEFYLCKWTRNTVSYGDLKQKELVRHCEDLNALSPREGDESYGPKWNTGWLCQV